MPVTGSNFTLDPTPQSDGSRWCREIHTLTGGSRVEISYLSSSTVDNAILMATRVPQLNEEAAEQETEDNLTRDSAPSTQHQTITQLLTRMRSRYRSYSRVELCQLSWWLQRRLLAGHITDAQCRAAFGMTTTAWSTFKTNKLIPRHDAWAAVLAATGE